MKIAENVILKGLKCKNGFFLMPILAVLLPFLFVFTFFNTSSANATQGNSDKFTSKEINSFDVSFQGKTKMIIRSYVINSLVLDVSGASTSNDAPVITYDFLGAENQLWLVEKADNGYIIRSWHSKKVLAIKMDKSLVVQQDYSGKDNQVWLISGTMDAARITNRANHQSLTVVLEGKLKADYYSASIGQLWKFESFSKLQKETVNCDCPKYFEYTRNLIETDYPGFQDKVNPKTRSLYDQLCKISVEKARSTTNSAVCYKIIDNYLSFFKDNHIQFSMENNVLYGTGEQLNPDKIRQFYAGAESVDMDENEVRTYLDRNNGILASIEGIWQTEDGLNRCTIIRDKKEITRFIGFVLKSDNVYWMPGQVKMDFFKQDQNLYTLYYGNKNHTIGKIRKFEHLSGNPLQVGNTKWYRTYPDIKAPHYQKKSPVSKNAGWFQLENLDDSTLLLSLPSFYRQHKAVVDDIIKTNKTKLLSTPYLVIDVRGNGGGTDETFERVLPFIYANPFEHLGTDIMASKYNINRYEELLRVPHVGADAREWIQKILNRMKDNPGKFVVRSSDEIVNRDTVMPNPRKIAVLINSGCGSSAEEFILFAKESKKVVLLGQPTSGTLDYSNISPREFPSTAFKISLPESRSHRIPNSSVDKEKIKPNIYLTEDQNWIDEAKKQLKKQNRD